jgi:hypothetical protein
MALALALPRCPCGLWPGTSWRAAGPRASADITPSRLEAATREPPGRRVPRGSSPRESHAGPAENGARGRGGRAPCRWHASGHGRSGRRAAGRLRPADRPTGWRARAMGRPDDGVGAGSPALPSWLIVGHVLARRWAARGCRYHPSRPGAATREPKTGTRPVHGKDQSRVATRRERSRGPLRLGDEARGSRLVGSAGETREPARRPARRRPESIHRLGEREGSTREETREPTRRPAGTDQSRFVDSARKNSKSMH